MQGDDHHTMLHGLTSQVTLCCTSLRACVCGLSSGPSYISVISAQLPLITHHSQDESFVESNQRKQLNKKRVFMDGRHRSLFAESLAHPKPSIEDSYEEGLTCTRTQIWNQDS